jgi:hypothetical protein
MNIENLRESSDQLITARANNNIRECFSKGQGAKAMQP